ncbi:hypothetical protein EG68_11852 [Paragonimus skrjabini miyazakii]|uniref:Aminopeptidase P N-terminal domain-containing protein n=1 Tax=Paragonimus skrjabini miyazakii TaxID=59628 RepID=A0A8S9YCW1_9TREM|nr:hypothetical protein EG68_11852 [Paragonimus skrjabini miyazakii]
MIRYRLIKNYLRDCSLFCLSRLPYFRPKCTASCGFASLVSVEEFSRRRLALATELGRYVSRISNTSSKHLLIFPASEVQYMAYHVPYPFHQDSNFLYFTGFLEANAVFTLTVLVEPSHNKLEPQIQYQEHLFVEVRSPHAELWDGPTLGIDNSIRCTGIRSVHDLQDFSQFLDANHSETVIWYSHLVQRPTENQTPNKFVLSEVLKLQRRTQKSAREIKNPDPIVDNLRLIKSPTEINLLRRAASVTSDCIMATMRFSRPGMLELGLLGVLEYEARLRGSSLGYPPVIAGGSRAHIIHYLKNDQILNNGDLVLVDCGCRYGGYTADITRTWPVNGHFNPAQRVLHGILEETQNTCAKAASPDRSLQDLHQIMMTELERHLVSEHIIPSKDSKVLVQKICPHSVGHFLGLDVHDTPTVSSTRLLSPGVVFPLEPGLYMRPELKALGVSAEFLGYGLRLEDDFVMSAAGVPVRLTDDLPRETRKLEEIIQHSVKEDLKTHSVVMI